MKRQIATDSEGAPVTKRMRFFVNGETKEVTPDESSDEYDEELDPRFPLVPLPEPRVLNWAHILAAVPREEWEKTKRFIIENHLDYFIDGDHPVGYPRANDTETLRFMPQVQWIKSAFETGALDLNKLVLTKMPMLERRQIHRDLAYSLQRYGELSKLGHRGWFGRHMCEQAPTLICEPCRPYWYLQEGTCPCANPMVKE